MTSKKFHLSDILMVTTNRLLRPGGMEGIYNILSFMTSDRVYSIQLSRVVLECRPYLFNSMPWLREIDASGVDESNWKEWMAGMVNKYGKFHDVETIPMDDHDIIDPHVELAEMLGDESKIIDLNIDDIEEPDPPEISPYGDITWKHD